MPFTSFSPPDSFTRHFDPDSRSYKYTWLLEREGPIVYRTRFSSLAPGSEASEATNFSDLQPAAKRQHLYQVAIGFYPGFEWKLFHPYNVRLLMLDDQTLEQTPENQTQLLRYDDSPVENPQVVVWCDEQRYPGLQPRNVGRVTQVPELIFYIAKFRTVPDEKLSSEMKDRLITGEIPSSVINFGGLI